jgi:hypothetical protein
MLCLNDSIRHDDPSLQPLLSAVEKAQTLTELILAAWPLARLLTIHIVEYVLAERALRPTFWLCCPACGVLLESKGFVKRQVTSLFGPLRWRRRVGRCPQGCAIGQVAPFDEELGLQPHQRTSGELQCLGCALAVFVPFATAARLLSWYSGASVSARSVWCWVQAAGQRAMDHLQAQLEAVAQGDLPSDLNVARKLWQNLIRIRKQQLANTTQLQNRYPLRQSAFHLPAAYPRIDLASLIQTDPQRFWITGRLSLVYHR